MKIEKEILQTLIDKGNSSSDISDITGVNARTIRWYYRKYGITDVPKFKEKAPWNKGLKAVDNPSIQRSVYAAHEARIGMEAWNKGTKQPPLTPEHKLKVSMALRGKYTGNKTSNWKGGITPINKLLRRSSDFKIWRTSVFERDNYTCQICNTRGGVLHPDHIKQFAYYPELRFELSNGRTLCESCHRKTDTWGNRKTKIVQH